MPAVQVERVVELTRAGAASSCRVDQGALARVLRGTAAARPVAVLSVAGGYRTGKSFLLNYCLQYLTADDSARRNGSWLGNSQQQLTGFSWRAGQEPHTTGIWMSTPVEVTLPSGQKVAVVLMDTQGTFDCQSTLRDCSTIFGLSTLLSSMQIYNLKENITSNDLQYLKYFADYGRLAMSGESSGCPFQALRFLIRDCYNPPYSLEGGARLLEARIGEQSQLTPELRGISREIRRCFESVDCYLVPHPGLVVPTTSFTGTVAELEPAFQTALLDLIPSMLAPEHLRLKALDGLPMTGQQLCQYFQSLGEVFSGDTMPEFSSLFEAHEEASLANAAWTAQEQFRAEMERTCGQHAPRCPPHVLREKHARARRDALRVAARAAASDRRRQQWRQRLEQDFDAALNQYLLINERKNETAVSTAKQLYENAMLGDIAAKDICKHPDDLAAAHRRGEAAALQEFDRNRERPAGVDAERNEFQAWITRRHDELKSRNGSNNDEAVTSCHEYFLSRMPGPTQNQISNAVTSVVKVFTAPYIVPFEVAEDFIKLGKTHQLFRDTKAEALARFERKRNPGGSSNYDEYKNRLTELIEAYEFPVSRYHVFSYRADIDGISDTEWD